MFIVKINCIVL